jgi:hypothetical protein
MAKHERRHLGEKNNKCDICGKAFIEKQELKNHLRTHTKVKPNKDAKTVKIPRKTKKTRKEIQSSTSSSEVCSSGSESVLDIITIQPQMTHEPFLNGVAPMQFQTVLSAVTCLDMSLNPNPPLAYEQNLTALSSSSNVVKLPPCNFGTYNMYDQNSDEMFYSCSLCSNCFQNSSQLKEHFVQYHRVDPDKVLSTLY